MATVPRIIRRAASLGLSTEVLALGDGHRRYTFYLDSEHGLRKHFQTCVGLALAEAWLDGYEAARTFYSQF